MTRCLTPTPAHSSGRRGLRAGLLLGLALVLSGCLKYDLTLLVSEDDTMDGTLIVAIAREFAVGEDILGQSGDLTPSVGSVTKEAYEDADYIGSRYLISGVPISEIDVLSTDSSTRYSLTHEGDEYVLDASLDFNVGGTEAMPTDTNFSALVSITFPGAVLESNGAIDGNSVVWTQLRADAENSLTARASAVANGEASSPTDSGTTPWWVWVLGGAGVLLVVGIIAAFVLRGRRTAKAAAAAAAPGTWPVQQQGGYDEYGTWVAAPVHGQQSGYYDSGQPGGYDSYYGTYVDASSGSYGDTYGGPPGTEPYPQTGPPPDGYGTAPYPEDPQGQPSGGYSGQTVVGHPGTYQPPSAWRPTPPG